MMRLVARTARGTWAGRQKAVPPRLLPIVSAFQPSTAETFIDRFPLASVKAGDPVQLRATAPFGPISCNTQRTQGNTRNNSERLIHGLSSAFPDWAS
jgi:hypothetical protein